MGLINKLIQHIEYYLPKGADLNSNPTISEGNLANVYQSRTKSLPEILSDSAFTVSESELGWIHSYDWDLIEGYSRVTQSKGFGDISNTYFILDIGNGHIPGVAQRMVEQGIDVHFVIPHAPLYRFHEAIKYWQDRHQLAKDTSGVVAYATAIDVHRPEALQESVFPSCEVLRRLGINRVIYLGEYPTKKPGSIGLANIVNETDDVRALDVVRILSKYANDFSVYAFNIDARGDKRRVHIINAIRWLRNMPTPDSYEEAKALFS